MDLVLALDPSSRCCGWAAGATLRDAVSGVWFTSNWRDAADIEAIRHARMCGRAMMWLADLITEHGPSLIVMETGGGRMTDRCSERLRGSLAGTAWVRQVAFEQVHPSTWQAWAKRHVGWTKEKKSDEQDARMILQWAIAEVLPRVEAA